MSDQLAPPDPWQHLAALTQARIGLGRAGPALPTREVLAFGLAHARARDAVHSPHDTATLATRLASLGLPIVHIASRAADRRCYLQRPDLGRRLDDASVAQLQAASAANGAAGCDIAIVLADGLSALACQRQGPPLLHALLPLLHGFQLAPLLIASQARVALADEAGALLGARLAIILLGERPGLSSPDSLGAYLTYAPQIGRRDAERNCVSNIRPEGLTPTAAAARLAWLIRQALQRQLSGVQLKDESDEVVLNAPSAA
ncbi:ethanolamine ammonia-lyase subunit EutC [Chitinimonas sp.]|uniref:ethanolamine ammonia-lyase subunit EutC n=1 Tax=Chitinimonas sp. TaxID=1934313 RepID=UPI0035B4891D